MIAFDLMPHHQYTPSTRPERSRRSTTDRPRRRGVAVATLAVLATFTGLGLTSTAMVHPTDVAAPANQLAGPTAR